MPANPENKELAAHKWLSLCVGAQDEPYVISSDGVLVIPLDSQQRIVFINEPDIPHGVPVLMVPGGAVDPGETPDISANREMQEEIGYKGLQLDLLGELHPLARHALWKIHVFLARRLVPSRLVGDENHTITIERVPFTDFEPLIAAGRLTDSTVIAGLYLTRSFLEKETQAKVPESAAEVGL